MVIGVLVEGGRYELATDVLPKIGEKLDARTLEQIVDASVKAKDPEATVATLKCMSRFHKSARGAIYENVSCVSA